MAHCASVHTYIKESANKKVGGGGSIRGQGGFGGNNQGGKKSKYQCQGYQMTDQSFQCQFIQSIKHMRNSEELISKASHLKFDFTKKRKIFSKQKKIS